MLKLSSPRRDIGAATVGTTVVFGGGCEDNGEYSCNNPTDAVDIFHVNGGAVPQSNTTYHLSGPRGWASTCAIDGKVAFLGGGKSESGAHSTVLDLLDPFSGQLMTNASALVIGRWGTTCVESEAGVVFAGGKEMGSFGQAMSKEVLVLKSGSSPVLSLGGDYGWSLSVAREATASAGLKGWGVIFGGGWITVPIPRTTAVVDTFELSSGKSYSWKFTGATTDKTTYWIGGAAYDDSRAFLADATHLYAITRDVFAGKSPPVASPLPAGVTGIPAARMARNGVKVGPAVCFYSAGSQSLLACYNVEKDIWTTHECSAMHEAGAMAAVNMTVLVAGGQTLQGAPVDSIDVF